MFRINILIFILCSSFSALCAKSDPVDIVYTWVDGSDPEWQKIRDTCFKEYFPLLENRDAHTINRFRNRDEIRYSLRSVLRFAPFVHHIFIVTFGQKPAWLLPHPKITIVDHTEIFKYREDLPTFNSQAIEANLHRIPNLSDKFIYLNDDVLFTNEVIKEDFFTEDGKIRVSFSDSPWPSGSVVKGEKAFISAQKNTNALLDSSFKKERRYSLSHAPFALRRSLMHEVEATFPHIFQQVSSHKFRMSSDFAMTNGLIQYYAIYTKKAHSSSLRAFRMSVTDDTRINKKRICSFLKGTYHSLCVEDSSIHENEEASQQLKEFLECLFPVPAPWEQEDHKKKKSSDPLFSFIKDYRLDKRPKIITLALPFQLKKKFRKRH
jgi:hypothetical protein